MSKHYTEQLAQLEVGESLECGCKLARKGWTRDDARDAFIKALAEQMAISEEIASKLPGETRMTDLPMTTVQLRRLRDTFWLPDGSLGAPEGRDQAEGDIVLELPDTINAFVDRIQRINGGISFWACDFHY